ncbi:MAG TPA: GNAT family N-acetyltransferase [Noviherbaspirillum sp.]|jgi:GNAT superfamily N-acetyltransferase|uniref:GNAT family N-acetyltransferase n=1 Tax=Noviherbaspirillum sp. TaxID=1926288 RepID=UPI002F9401A6
MQSEKIEKIGIRTAKADDAHAVCSLLCRSIAECCTEDHRNDPAILAAWLGNKTPENVAAWFACGANLSLVAEIDRAPAGVAIFTRAGKIVLFYVCPDRRFQGVGKRLLQEVERQAATIGLQSLQIPSTLTARRFYERSGYVTRCTTVSAYGAEAISMSKQLPPGAYPGAKPCRCGAA